MCNWMYKFSSKVGNKENISKTISRKNSPSKTLSQALKQTNSPTSTITSPKELLGRNKGQISGCSAIRRKPTLNYINQIENLKGAPSTTKNAQYPRTVDNSVASPKNSRNFHTLIANNSGNNDNFMTDVQVLDSIEFSNNTYNINIRNPLESKTVSRLSINRKFSDKKFDKADVAPGVGASIDQMKIISPLESVSNANSINLSSPRYMAKSPLSQSFQR